MRFLYGIIGLMLPLPFLVFLSWPPLFGPFGLFSQVSYLFYNGSILGLLFALLQYFMPLGITFLAIYFIVVAIRPFTPSRFLMSSFMFAVIPVCLSTWLFVVSLQSSEMEEPVSYLWLFSLPLLYVSLVLSVMDIATRIQNRKNP